MSFFLLLRFMVAIVIYSTSEITGLLVTHFGRFLLISHINPHQSHLYWILNIFLYSPFFYTRDKLQLDWWKTLHRIPCLYHCGILEIGFIRT